MTDWFERVDRILQRCEKQVSDGQSKAALATLVAAQNDMKKLQKLHFEDVLEGLARAYATKRVDDLQRDAPPLDVSPYNMGNLKRLREARPATKNTRKKKNAKGSKA
jgi:hypothetical protein